MQVVLIEADSVAAFLIERQLRREEAILSITTFPATAEAVPYLQRQAAQNTPPDVVVLSLRRPLEGGWDVLDTLAPLVAASSRVYVLIAAIWPIETKHMQQHLLVTAVFHKPFNSQDLQQLLA